MKTICIILSIAVILAGLTSSVDPKARVATVGIGVILLWFIGYGKKDDLLAGLRALFSVQGLIAAVIIVAGLVYLFQHPEEVRVWLVDHGTDIFKQH